MLKNENIDEPRLFISDYLCVKSNFKRNRINNILDYMIRWDISIKDLELELDKRAEKQ